MHGDRLSGLDASFLHMEQGPAHMHVASTAVFEGAAPSYDEFRDHIASRLHLVPRFRQKLRFVPFGQGRPVWVDDPQLNLDYHVRHTALPSPGSEEQLRLLAARIFSQRLDRSKPVWEMWLVDGLEGDRFAVVAKSHHCLVDGVSGVDITTVMYDVGPESDRKRSPEPWIPDPEPTEAQLLGDALLERATNPREMVRGARALVRGPRQALSSAVEALESAGAFAKAGFAAPPSPFNVDIGPYRRFAIVRSDLAELKRVKNAAGGTVNDVILAAVTGAVGRYLRERGHSTQGLELRAMVPISVRAQDEHGALGNRVSAMMATLPVWCEDPLERLRVVSHSMGDLKSSHQAMGAGLLTEPGRLRAADDRRPSVAPSVPPAWFNFVVTNVPGPQFPLYLLGRRLLEVYPMVPLAKRQGVCFGIMSYDGTVNFGLTADYDAMPDLEALAGDLGAALEELSDAMPAERKRKPARRPTKAKAKSTS